jgi:HEPN domain-containing protein
LSKEPTSFLLLGVHADHRLAVGDETLGEGCAVEIGRDGGLCCAQSGGLYAGVMVPLDAPEFDRWLEQAARALDTAALAREGERFEWTCFLAEQAARLALNGLLRGIGCPAWGHDLVELAATAANELRDSWDPALGDPTARLSRHYIPTRYPDAFAAGAPGSHYTRGDGDGAIDDAVTILDFVRHVWLDLEADG